MALYKYKLLNGGGVMLMKRWFGFLWRDHENFDNHIRKQEAKLQELYDWFVTADLERQRLVREKKDIITGIDSPNGKMKGMGEPFAGRAFTGLKKPDVAKPGDDWRLFVKALKGVFKGKSGGTSSFTLSDAPEMSGVVERATIPTSDRRRLENVSRSNSNNNGKQRGNNNQH